MEIVIAVVQMQNKKSEQISGNTFDVLLVNEPCSSSRHEIRMQLPRCHVPSNSDPAEIALSFVQNHCRFFFFHTNFISIIIINYYYYQ